MYREFSHVYYTKSMKLKVYHYIPHADTKHSLFIINQKNKELCTLSCSSQ